MEQLTLPCSNMYATLCVCVIGFKVAFRHRRDMTEKLLKATLNPKTHTHKVVTVTLLSMSPK